MLSIIRRSAGKIDHNDNVLWQLQLNFYMIGIRYNIFLCFRNKYAYNKYSIKYSYYNKKTA